MQPKPIAEMMAAKKNAGGAAFLAANGKKPNIKTTATGLQYGVISEDRGIKPKPTDVVQVELQGSSRSDGTVFDDSSQHGGPADDSAIAGGSRLREGISLMPVGSSTASGSRPRSVWRTGHAWRPDPPNATLVFEVEPFDVAGGGQAADAAGALEEPQHAGRHLRHRLRRSRHRQSASPRLGHDVVCIDVDGPR